ETLRRGVETVHLVERLIGKRQRSPSVQLVTAVQELIDSAGDVREAQERPRAVVALWNSIKTDVAIHRGEPWADATISPRDLTELTTQTIARCGGAGTHQRRETIGDRRIARCRWTEDVRAVVRAPATIDVSRHTRRECES